MFSLFKKKKTKPFRYDSYEITDYSALLQLIDVERKTKPVYLIGYYYGYNFIDFRLELSLNDWECNQVETFGLDGTETTAKDVLNNEVKCVLQRFEDRMDGNMVLYANPVELWAVEEHVSQGWYLVRERGRFYLCARYKVVD